jgi:hypothetical protein
MRGYRYPEEHDADVPLANFEADGARIGDVRLRW